MTDLTPSPAGRPLFPLGQVTATPSALEALGRAGVATDLLLARHVQGDWGDLDEHDWHMNDLALSAGERLLSAYSLPDATRLWIITEADRLATILLLPNDY